MDVRWEGESIDRIQIFAKELVELQPDVILSTSTLATAAVQRETRTMPIVFVSVSDPVGSGFIAGQPHPGGNITGFMLEEPSLAGKLLELLTEIAPGVKRAALMFNPDMAPYVESYYLPVFEAAARTLKDRILRGAKPADLPVQLPVKFVMGLNVKTAKALGLEVPASILLRADEVVE